MLLEGRSCPQTGCQDLPGRGDQKGAPKTPPSTGKTAWTQVTSTRQVVWEAAKK